MATADMTIKLDARSLEEIAHLADFEARSYPFLREAMAQSLTTLQSEATNWMWAHFANPTGALESAWAPSIQGPYLGILENTSPYGQRRNFGFSGMTDALGRYYPHDPGIDWAENAITNSLGQVETNFRVAYERTLEGL